MKQFINISDIVAGVNEAKRLLKGPLRIRGLPIIKLTRGFNKNTL